MKKWKYLNKDYIESLKQTFRTLEDKRDELMQIGRTINKNSKTIIYSLIRDDWEEAEKYIKENRELVKQLYEEVTKKYPQYYNSAFIPLQEFVEAEVVYHYLKEGRIPTHEELGIPEEAYVTGLMDAAGELLRKAVEEMIKDNLDFALKVREILEEIYLAMLSLNFKNFEYRKKVDYVGGVLNRLIDYIFQKQTRRGESLKESKEV
ncbi:MAG: haloacid dehalogenase [Aquificae bacterium]|nr:haloacid dehalogenase [Aquificota bacterium]